MARPQKVTVFDLYRRGDRWLVRWRVDRRDVSRSRRSKAQADRLRRAIADAVDAGERFDPVSGEPESWARGETLLAFALEWLPGAWRSWRPKTRRTVLEGTVDAVLVLTDTSVSSERSELLRPYLRLALSPEGAPETVTADVRRAVEWLHGHSLPLSAINGGHVRDAYTVLAHNLDGSLAKPETFGKRRAGVTRVLGAAAERLLIPANPAAGIRLPRRQVGQQALSRAEIPTVAEAQQLIIGVGLQGPAGRRLVAYLALSLYAGLRPGEANAVRATDLDLPESGWGLVRVRRSLVEVGERFSDDGETTAEGTTKTGIEREVPLHPDAVALLRLHLELWPVDGGPVLTNAGGGVLSSNVSRSLLKAKTTLGWTGTHRLAAVHHYSFRHSCASTLLDAGMPEAVVAQRMGHSIEELIRTYWHVIKRDADQMNAKVEGAFR